MICYFRIGKGNLMRENESPLRGLQNDAIRTNNVKEKLIICDRIANVGYVEKEMKQLIT